MHGILGGGDREVETGDLSMKTVWGILLKDGAM